mgnify:CR=1 FL=1
MDDRQILKDGFAQFVTAARELESGYAALKKRAAAVDLELQASNRALQQSLAEREAVFSALPIGLVALRGDGSQSTSNCEAERLISLAQDAGVDLLEGSVGEVVFDGTVVGHSVEKARGGVVVMWVAVFGGQGLVVATERLLLLAPLPTRGESKKTAVGSSGTWIAGSVGSLTRTPPLPVRCPSTSSGPNPSFVYACATSSCITHRHDVLRAPFMLRDTC